MSSLGVIVGNDVAKYDRFSKWLGRHASFALLAFNQNSPDAFKGSISFIAKQGAKFAQAGATIIWSVPCPGGQQLEAISNGSFDDLYKTCADAILNSYDGRDRSPLYVRLPWEFNLPGQQNNARDKNGNWNGALFITAWIRLARIFRSSSPRFKLIWCPNIERHAIAPIECWPGPEHVDIISQDFYLQKKWSKPGAFRQFFMTCDYGLTWGTSFAKHHGKQYALSEYGIDDDMFADDAAAMFAWIKALGPLLNHHAWWDRPENINCLISSGALPLIGDTYRKAFGRSR